ncbi:MAG TPA: lamin tail domain-containing protein, partial [Anaeromyxobacteraceae bacterium]|nr:lamin tail domain-containing protein [Anaeromyxobacteraceae bacterium]
MNRAIALIVAVAGCGLPEADGHVRVIEGLPAGTAVACAAIASVRFSGAVSPEGLLDGRRLVLVREADLSAALAAVESEAGADAATPRVAGAIALEEGGTRAVLRPGAPLPAGEALALVVSSRARAEDGRAVLDAEG